jgi:hypothetical protein
VVFFSIGGACIFMSQYTQFKPIREESRASTTSAMPSAKSEGFFGRFFRSSTSPLITTPAVSAESVSPPPVAEGPVVSQQNVIAPRPWMPDELVNRCHSCDLNFTAVRRRHHCRVCGQIFCNACSDNYLDRSLMGFEGHEVIRVCNFCLRSHNQQKRMSQMSTPQKQAIRDADQERQARVGTGSVRQISFEFDQEQVLRSKSPVSGVPSAHKKMSMQIDASESEDVGAESEEERRVSKLNKSFWDEESVPSYPIDRRVSVIAAPQITAVDTSFASAQSNELRKVSTEHLSRVVETLLASNPLLVDLSDVWLPCLCKLAAKAAGKVVLRVPDAMDVKEYVQVKVVTGGLPSEAHYVRGVVLRKTMIHTKMKSQMDNPRVLLMGCAIQFSRPDWRFVEFDVLQVQERDFLRILVDRIALLKPDILVTSESVSSLALEFLMDAGISCVSCVNSRALERLARFTGSSIVRNLSDFHLAQIGGDCGHLRASSPTTLTGVRNFLYFEDCSASRGGTIVLRGGDTQVLHALKKVLLFAVFTAYHLRLEDAFVADLSLHMMSSSRVMLMTSTTSSSAAPPVSMSPSVSFPPPVSGVTDVPVAVCTERGSPDLLNVHSAAGLSALSVNFDYESVLRSMGECDGSRDKHDSILDNQSITYCFSQHQSEKRSHCITYQYHHIPFYSKMDLSLLAFLRWSCLLSPCSVQTCGRPLCEHESSFLYGNKRMFVSTSTSVATSASSFAEVLTWFGCNECQETSQPKPLSRDAQELSFGKLMELLFLNRSLSCSVGHQVNPNGTLVFSTAGRLVSFSFMRTPVFSVEAPAREMRANLVGESALVEKELSALAAAAHVSYAVIKKRVPTAEGDVLAREEGDFLQSINDAKRSRLLQINRLFRLLLTNVMRWQGSLEASSAAAASEPEATPGTRRLLGMSVSAAPVAPAAALASDAASVVIMASAAGVGGAASVFEAGVPLEGTAPAVPGTGKLDASLLVRLIKKSGPQVPQLHSEIVEAMASSLNKESTMYRLFCGRGAPMPLSSLTNEVVLVLDDEPSSHIACALGTDLYREQMHDILGPLVAGSSQGKDVNKLVDLERMSFDVLRKFALSSSSSGANLLPQAIKVSFESMLPRLQYVCDVTIYYPVQFAALRRLYCGGEQAFVFSMARSQAWAAKEEGGGASKV